LVAVIHCVLNQNTRDPGSALHGGVSRPLLPLLLEHETGILQMPCPEMACLGLKRARPKGVGIRGVLDTPWGRRCCRCLAAAVADQIDEHTRNRHEVLAVVGGDDESPGCAVHVSKEGSAAGRLEEASGVFMKALEAELDARGLRVPFLAMRESSSVSYQKDLVALDQVLAGNGIRGDLQ
jgi:predicted secreted protein